LRFALLIFLLAHTLAPALNGALQLLAAGVRQIEDGPPVPPGTTFVPGETVYYSVQVTGYTAISGAAPGTTPADQDTRKVRLNYKMDAFDPKGVKVVETIESILDTTISQQDKEWKPKVRSEILLPTFAPPGEYKVVTTVTDDVSKSSASSETRFEVVGRSVESSAELTIRNFGFYRSEDDVKPIATAAYRAGDTLFARFDMVGFRFGERNTIDLSYDVAVLNPDGKEIYSQPNAAVEKSFSFYPKPFVPGGMNLSLQPNMRKGDYTVVLAIHDLIGRQNYETRQSFSVE
jgi:hypothetical protein